MFLKETLDDYKGINLYTQQELEGIRDNLLITKKYLDARGIEFMIFIAPNKASIYGDDYLPDYIVKNSKQSRMSELVNYLNETTDIKVIFPVEELIQLKNDYPDYPLYMHLDTHWNYWGGYSGTKILLHELHVELPDVNIEISHKLNMPVFNWNGYDLAKMLGMTKMLDKDINYDIGYEWQNKYTTGQDTVNNEKDFSTYIKTKSDAPDKRKVMFVRDSFGTPMLPFLASSFREVYSPHGAYFNQER